MRPAVFVCAVVTGTVARFLFTKLMAIRRNRRTRISSSTEHNVSSAWSPVSWKRSRHPQVLALLNAIAPVMRGASYTDKHGSDRDCTFCLEGITSASPFVRVTPCRHVYHAECLEQWVLYSASASLDWRNYVVCDDGSVDVTATPPSCPNCTARLPVLPPSLVRVALLTSIAHSLSLPNLSAAAHMYDAGLVFRAPPTSFDGAQPFPTTPTAVATATPPTFFFSQEALTLENPQLAFPPIFEDIPANVPIAAVPPPSIRVLERNGMRPVVATNPNRNTLVSPHTEEE